MKKIFLTSITIFLTLILIFKSRRLSEGDSTASLDTNNTVHRVEQKDGTSKAGEDSSNKKANNKTPRSAPTSNDEDRGMNNTKTERVKQSLAADADYSEVNKYLSNRQYKKAIDLMNSWPQEHKKTLQYYTNMGLANVALRDWQNAELLFEKAADESPYDSNHHYNSLEMSFVQKKWEPFLEKAAHFRENFSESRKDLGNLVEFKEMIAYVELGEENQLSQWKTNQQSIDKPLALEVINALELIKSKNYTQADIALDKIYTDYKDNKSLAIYIDSLQEMGYMDWDTK